MGRSLASDACGRPCTASMLPRHPFVHPTPRRPSLCRGIAMWSHRCDGKPSPQTPRDGIPSPLPHAPRRPQPRISQAPHDRTLQTPTPCGISHAPPAAPHGRSPSPLPPYTTPSLSSATDRPVYPSVSLSDETPPATAPCKHPRRAESFHTNPAALRDGIPSPLPQMPRPRDKALHVSLRPPLMRANAPGL